MNMPEKESTPGAANLVKILILMPRAGPNLITLNHRGCRYFFQVVKVLVGLAEIVSIIGKARPIERYQI